EIPIGIQGAEDAIEFCPVHGPVHTEGQRAHHPQFEDDLTQKGFALFIIHQYILPLFDDKIGYFAYKVHTAVLHLPGYVLGKEQQVRCTFGGLDHEIAFADDIGTDLTDLADCQPAAQGAVYLCKGTMDHVLNHDHRADVEVDVVQPVLDSIQVAVMRYFGRGSDSCILPHNSQMLGIIDDRDITLRVGL